MLPTGQKHSKVWCLGFTKLYFLQKLSPLVHFDYSSLESWFVGIIYQSFQKDSFKSYTYSPTFKLCFIALYEMIQQNFFKSLAASSKQVSS